jgi:predicted nucleic acid-binding protein
MQIAIDSSVLVALINPRDLWRDQALALENALLAKSGKLFYFDCVVAEAISVAARRLHEKNLAAEVGALLDRLNARVPQETITWILPDAPRLYAEALALMRSSAGALNFNDALIALACRERSIPAIASFDPDFDQVSWLRRLARPDDLTT